MAKIRVKRESSQEIWRYALLLIADLHSQSDVSRDNFEYGVDHVYV